MWSILDIFVLTPTNDEARPVELLPFPAILEGPHSFPVQTDCFDAHPTEGRQKERVEKNTDALAHLRIAVILDTSQEGEQQEEKREGKVDEDFVRSFTSDVAGTQN